ncbi:P-loop containing nucleoside triphosphate hydrolase protein [Panus rudis PR-1116 ss-1]|nr:P-loop containing nucleoside triphosphate hydrolase protein [Panus rudis PR-1116 ss-1]
MVRRASSVVTDESQKENSPRSRRSDEKASKTRRGGLKESQAARVEHEDEDVEQSQMNGHNSDEDAEGSQAQSDAEEEEEREGSPKGRKRARANTVGDAHTPEPEPRVKKQVTLPRDVDGYIPGSIVRIRLKNFVTYDSVEFFPGPRLNMILGPNGTGKSSIACAICLGLNFPPHVLGRATDLPSFVKNDATEGYIEIELKGPKGQPNLVIKRTLSQKSKSSQFYLNNESVSGKEINARMAELNVQVSNLCSFLPQDRVAEFARMSPQQLLRETQRAAGDENLTAWHDTLIAAGRELKTLQESMVADREQLKTLQERNASLEREVKLFEQRRAIEQEIELLEILVAYREYNDLREKFRELKHLRKETLEKANEIAKKNAPILALTELLAKQHKQLEATREQKKAAAKKKFEAMRLKWNHGEALDDEAEELKNKLASLKEEERERQRKIRSLENLIQSAQETIANPPKTESLDDINEQLKAALSENREIRDRQTDLHERVRAYVTEQAKHKFELERAQRELTQLDDLSSRKLVNLRRADPDAADAVEWIRQNQHRFKMEIVEPPMLSLDVPDKAFASAIEANFPWNDLRTFVAQCDEDYKLLNRLLVDTPEALGRKVRLNTWYKSHGQIAPPPVSPEELRALGFDGFAIDFVRCPDGLRWFLENNLQLHRTAIAVKNPNRVNVQRANEIYAGTGGRYIIGNVSNTVSRSKYGKRLPFTATSGIKGAQWFTQVAVDPSIKERIQTQIRDAQTQLQVCNEKIEELKSEDAKIKAAMTENDRKKNNLLGRKNAVVDAQKKLQGTRLKLESDQRKLQQLLNAPSLDEERARLKREILQCARKRAGILKDYEKLIREAIRLQEEATRVGLQFAQLGANMAKVKSLYKERQEEHSAAVARYKDIEAQFHKVKDDAHDKLNESKQLLKDCSPETGERFQEMDGAGQINARTVDEYKDDLAVQQGNLEFAKGANPGVVEQYHNRVQAIKELSERIEDREEKIQKKERSIKIARDNWEPALTKLVESVGQKFSTAFDRIGCAGEIKVTPHEDYDKWAIDILVKFRDDEKLQLLTGERQSGGERSLTTIMYLMSLTEQARTPFSLVDEINQGMDARAERAVHNSLVEVTCKEDSCQYFLITPKLLADLNYHERMKVLCVNNGEWLPEETDRIGNMMGMIEAYVHYRNQNHSRSSA